jgi:hypothetical protein
MMDDELTKEVLPAVEETRHVDKRQISEKVRVRIVTDSVEEIARQTLESNVVEITRVPVDKIVEIAPTVRTEGDVTIVPVFEGGLVDRTENNCGEK